MPVNFDFSNGGASVRATGTNPGPVTNTDTDTVSGTQGVTFTINTDAAGGDENVLFGNSGNPALPLNLNDDGGGTASNDVWTLTFQDTANAANTQLSGTAGNPVALQIGNVGNNGSVRVEFLTMGGGVAAATTASGLRSTFLGGTIPGNESFTFSTIAPNISGIRFTSLGGGTGAITLEGLSANELNCFLTGTQIATPDGDVAVETLQQGDTVLTAEGKPTEVKWVGVQTIDARVNHPATVNPICITAGALAEGVPARDLYVTGDHAIAIDGLLVNASALVNDRSIYQVRQMPLDGFSYYHIETEAHEVLLAEGCPAESLAGHQADRFDNRADRPEREIVEMDLPRITARRLLPETTRARIDARTEAAQDMKIAV